MARASSKSSGSTGNRRREPTPSDSEATLAEISPPQELDSTGDSVPPVQDSSAEGMTPPDIDASAPASADDRVIEAKAIGQEAPKEADTAARPAPMPEPPRQSGFVALVLGGVVAAGIGYGAAYMGWLPTRGASNAPDTEMMQALAALQDQIAALPATAPEAAAPVDLSPVLDQIAALSARIDTTNGGIETLAARVGALEDRPTATLELGAEATQAQGAAAIAEAEAAAQAAMAEAEAAATAAKAEADAAIAAAQAEAAAALTRAEATAALGLLQAAIANGTPYAEPLAQIAAVTTPAEVLTRLAETGIPTQEALQQAFPALARAALPIALQETAGEGMSDRLGAFVMGQIGGRSVAPREGDDPDAVLSRVEAAVRTGDLATVLSEIAALPEGARAVLAPWVADVEARAAAEAGLAALTDALAAGGN